jgi:hypothetical protein
VAEYSSLFVAADCVHSVETVRGFGRGEEGLIFREEGEVNLI